MEPKQAVELLVTHGLVGGVVCMSIFILGLHREWWVMGAHFRSAVKNLDEYKVLLQKAEESAKETRHVLADSAKETRQVLAEMLRKLEAKS